MRNVKNFSHRLFIYFFIFILTILVLLYLEGTALKAQKTSTRLLFKIDPLSKIKTYCNNNTRLVGSLYVLSYTLFGKNSWEKYGKNVRKVVENAAKSSFFVNWTVRLYYDFYPEKLQNSLTKIYKKLEFCDVNNLFLPFDPNLKVSNINGMTWRFIPMADPTVFIMCSRDLDSDVYKREEDAVRYWMHTNKTLHSMRDNPAHNIEILGGMWCYRTANSLTRATDNLELILKNAGRRSSTSEAEKGDDQDMLQKYLWPVLKNDVIQHDSYLCKKYPGSIPYPSQRSAINEVIGGPREMGLRSPVCPKECRPRNHLDWLYC